MRWLKWIAVILLLLWPSRALADGRIEYNDQPCQVFWWDLISFEDYESACTFGLYNQGPPTASEVRAFCGPDLSEAWYQTAQISPGSGAPDTGFYTLLSKIEFSTCKTASELAPVKFTWGITGNKLAISASEPIQGQQITSISGYIGQHPFECSGNSCQVLITPTAGNGVEVWFQALSTLSEDPTSKQKIYIRYNPPASPELVDDQHGSRAQQIWGSFPARELPAWLAPEAKSSDVGLAYLAGRLIANGVVDASGCGSGGMLWNGYADVCGVEAARPQLRIWQNKYNSPINQAAADEGIPGQLLKNLIAAESQFWDQAHINWGGAGEIGLGQLTHAGVDTILLWDPDFYQQICQPLFGAECGFGYTRLDGWQRSALQNSVMEDAGIPTIARALAANAAQAGAIIQDITGQRPGAVFSHQDLWRLSLVNYHSGPGCLAAALREAKSAGYALDWGSVGASLDLFCPMSSRYVNRITTSP